MRKVFLNTLKPEEIIKRLKNGEIVKCTDRDDGFIFKMIDGVIVMKDDKGIIIGDSITINEIDDYYFEEEEPFEITEIGFYKTRDGRKAYVSDIENYAYGVIEGERGVRWSLEGRWAVTNLDGIDIVSKWED